MIGRKFLVWVGLALVLVNCGGDDTSSSPDVSVAAGQESFTWGSDVRSQDILLTGKGSWSVRSDADCQNWCYPVKASGNSSSIPLWVSPNITNKARSGKVTVTVGGRSQTITVSQPAFSGDLDEYVYHLPVVFHVLYKDAKNETQNAPASQFNKIITEVNKLYAANGMNIVFEMAQYDKEGEKLAEPGIIRHQMDFDELDAGDFLGSTDSKYKEFADYQLNLKKYINIFVFPFKQEDDETTSLGLTALPLATSAYPLDGLTLEDKAKDYAYLAQTWGVCVNSEYIDEWQDDKSVNAYYIVSTLAHELGHYLGLLHTFSETGCEEDDYCDDTNISDYENYSTYMQNYIARELAKDKDRTFTIIELSTRNDCKTGEEFVAKNILDYMYTSCTEFTKQQFDRTRYVLKYSPLVPGPKLVDYNTTGKGMRGVSTTLNIKRPNPCPKVPVKQMPPVIKN
ncbi:MAG: zinc-dependent metalloproteinase lipoprotein [Prevotella sp.]|nr:zinc-dependent metalloproteinase lipoprotein [Prevotella sp.]